jgi:hypothetical protein
MATSVFLDRENQAFIDEANKPGNPPLEDLSVQQIRDEFEQLQKHSPIPGVDVTDFHVPMGTKKSDSIRTVVFRAEHLKKEDLPVIFWIHGGGWIAGKYVDTLWTTSLVTKDVDMLQRIHLRQHLPRSRPPNIVCNRLPRIFACAREEVSNTDRRMFRGHEICG